MHNLQNVLVQIANKMGLIGLASGGRSVGIFRSRTQATEFSFLIGLESQEYGRRDPSRWPRGTLYPQKLELTSPTNGCGSVGIVRLRTQATEFTFF
jgi:hypothetical protein